MATSGLSSEEVQKQLKQMVNFILKEANEKAEEIKVKAKEEFNIEKQRLLQAERVKILKDYEKKNKQVEVQKKIAYSNELNQARLKSLKSREDAVTRVIGEAYRRLTSISSSPNYEILLTQLIVQALIKLEEPASSVLCREQDERLVKSAIPKAVQQYKELTGRDVKLTLSNQRISPVTFEGLEQPSCAGGIVLSAQDGKILCNNTLEQRLQTSFEQLLPTIRTILFGHSTTRKFFH